jgi:hypothetical protein
VLHTLAEVVVEEMMLRQALVWVVQAAVVMVELSAVVRLGHLEQSILAVVAVAELRVWEGVAVVVVVW